MFMGGAPYLENKMTRKHAKVHHDEALTGNVDHIGENEKIGNVGPGEHQPQCGHNSDTRCPGYGSKGDK